MLKINNDKINNISYAVWKNGTWYHSLLKTNEGKVVINIQGEILKMSIQTKSQGIHCPQTYKKY